MKRSFRIIASLCLLTGCCVVSQSAYSQGAKSVYFELGGPGLASFNFDTRFSNSENGIGGRIGVGGFKIDDAGAVFFPVAVNYLLGKDDRHYFEIGAGGTFVSVSEDDSVDQVDEDSDPFSGSCGHLHFGYRLQPFNGGFTFRAGMTPVFGDGYFIPYYFSLSFGYKF